ncbi:MAG TPA: amino acid adenylation domain-containing protein [Kofleriaceae bacterium]|jgi:amino acid adenylation domain-containing protein
MEATLFGSFERVVAAQPDRIAVREATRTWTYAQLLARVNAIAAHLDEHGAGDRVACLLSHGGEMVAAILGVLAGGRAYVTLDPTHPTDRSRFVLADSGATALLHDAAHAATATRLAGDVPRVRADEATEGRVPARRPTPETLAYCLYTSGSTGRPKGVPQVHANVLHFIDAYSRCLAIEPTDSVSLLSTFAFDAAVVDVFSALLAGATLCPYDLRDAGLAGLSTMLVDRGVTIYHSTPTVFRELAQMEPRLSPRIRAVVLGGEEVRAADVTQFRAAFAPSAILVNGYGMTECSWALLNVLRPDDEIARATVPIGWPIDGVRIRLEPVDDESAPEGVGTIVIECAHVAGRYWQRPDETAAAFPVPGTYVTTDFGRQLPDGRFEFAGRKASHVKLRGFRIDLREIEAVVLTHPGVREAVVDLRATVRGDELIAYVAGRPGHEPPDIVALRAHLSAKLPGYMLPAAVVRMAALPRGATNKIDRRALPAPEAHTRTRTQHLAPRTATEQAIAAIWQDVLGAKRIGVHDDFFARGGHSLIANRVTAAIRTQLGVELPPRALFEAPTLGPFASRVDAVREKAPARATPLVAAPRDERPPLSFAQQRLWFLHQLEPDSRAYHLHASRRLENLDVAALRSAFEALAARHEILRTSFPAVDGAPYQRVHATAPRSIAIDDARGLTERAQLDRIAARELAMDLPFDLAAAPPIRVELVRVTETAYVLLWTLHHILTDGGSRDVMERELWTLYDAFATDVPPSPIDPLPLQYADFAAWQRTWLVGTELSRQLAFWTTQLAGAPPELALPRVGSRPAFEGKRVTARLPTALAEQLRALAHRRGATLFMTFAAALRATLARYSGQSDVVIGAPIDNRSHAELSGLIGMFANTVALRGEVRADDTFASLLVREKAIALDAYEYQHTPFELVVDALHVERALGRSPVFQVMYQHVEEGPPVRGEVVDTGRAPVAPVDLTIESWSRGGELGIDIVFDIALFDASLITRFTHHVERFLAEAAADPHRQLVDLDLLDSEERRLLSSWGTGPSAAVPDACLHQLIEAQVDRNPEALAVVCEGEQLTYRELDERANQLAHHLRARGVGPEMRVGLRVRRSADLMVGLLGILKAGGAYVPLDPKYPAARLAFMVEDSGATVVVTEDKLTACAHQSRTRVEPMTRPEHLAYVIYTSGTTGRPKGVMVEHRHIVNFALRWGAIERLTPADRVLQMASLSFDGSVSEIFPAWLFGATLVMRGEEVPAAHEIFGAAFAGITVAFFPTAYFHTLDGQDAPRSLRLAYYGGERVSPTHARSWLERAPHCALHNVYGPAEASCITTTMQLTLAELPPGRETPIGRAMPNYSVQVLDAHRRLVPIGVIGELYIGGESVARGYLGRPELTAENFVANPSGEGRLYRSGDLVRWRADGILEFIGRIDQQVKLRGYRIELGEIEAALLAQPAVDGVAIVVREDRAGAPRLVAYVVGHALNVATLATELATMLPEFMVPSAFVVLDELPMTANGKLDRAALPAPELEKAAEFIAPRDAIETTIADVWSGVLGVDRVGLHDDFFALGGHSLSATRAAAAIRTRLGVELPLRAFFEARTLASLAARVAAAGTARVAALPLVARPRGERPLLSFSQQRLWFLHQLAPESRAYHLGESRRIEHLDVDALRRAFEALIARHEILRTSFPAVDGVPYQRVHPAAAWELRVEDARPFDAAAVIAAVHTRQRLPFDLSTGPLLRTDVVRVTDDAHVLVLTLHHIVTDGWSQDLIWRDLWAYYTAFASRRVPSLAPLPLQYADFAAWQRAWMSGTVLERQLAFWTTRLRDSPEETVLPVARPRPTRPTERHAAVETRLHANVSAALHALAQREGATLFMVLLAGFRALLSCVTGQNDVVIGTPIAGRNRREIEELVGFFINTLALRGEVSPDDAFTSALAREKAGALAAYDHQDIPFELVVEALHIERRIDITPLFQIWFVHQNMATRPLPEGVSAYGAAIEEASKFDLALYSQERDGTIELSWHYNPDLFDAPAIQRIVAHYETLLAAVVAHPGRRIADSLPGAVVARSAPRISQARTSTADFVEARTPLELQLADVWRDLLHVERVGRHDNFFALGGHSLLAIRLLTGVKRRLGVTIPLRELFVDPTLAGLAARIGQTRATGRAVDRPALHASATRRARLPAALRGVFKLNKMMSSDRFARHVWSTWIDGPLDVRSLERAVAAMRVRHALLRTRFFEERGREMLEVLALADVERFAVLERADLSSLSAAEQEQADAEFHQHVSFRPLDVSHGEVMSVALSRWSATRHRLTVSLHNIVSDAESLMIYVNELCELWRAFAEEPERDPLAILPPAPLQYHHLADYLERVRESELGRAQRAFWKSRLEDFQALELPIDSPRDEVDARREANAGIVAFRSGSVEHTLSNEILIAIEESAERRRATVMSTLVAAMAGYLSERTSQHDLAFITRLSHRYIPGLERTLGFLVNPIVLRISTAGAPAFSQLVERTHAVVTDAFDHGECDIFEIAPYSAFRLCLVYTRATPGGELPLPDGNTAIQAPHPGASGGSQIGYDLLLWLKHHNDRVTLYLAYNLELFRDTTAATLLDGYVSYLGRMIAID